MKVLVTGAAGFVGKNLVASLKNIRDGKDRTRPELSVDEIYEYDIQTDPALLEEYCAKADFVFNLAGVNRPKDNAESVSYTHLDVYKRQVYNCKMETTMYIFISKN